MKNQTDNKVSKKNTKMFLNETTSTLQSIGKSSDFTYKLFNRFLESLFTLVKAANLDVQRYDRRMSMLIKSVDLSNSSNKPNDVRCTIIDYFYYNTHTQLIHASYQGLSVKSMFGPGNVEIKIFPMGDDESDRSDIIAKCNYVCNQCSENARTISYVSSTSNIKQFFREQGVRSASVVIEEGDYDHIINHITATAGESLSYCMDFITGRIYDDFNRMIRNVAIDSGNTIKIDRKKIKKIIPYNTKTPKLSVGDVSKGITPIDFFFEGRESALRVDVEIHQDLIPMLEHMLYSRFKEEISAVMPASEELCIYLDKSQNPYFHVVEVPEEIQTT